ncbi:unnamed protein product [Prunus armeniaca]
MGLFLSRNIADFVFSSLFSKKNGGNFIPMQIQDVVSLVSRTGRHMQRYDKGCRQVVGCVPYRFRKIEQSSSLEELEVLVISSQKGQGMLFPKGGWEIDESIEDAAKRETLEEAGVIGHLGVSICKTNPKSVQLNFHRIASIYSSIVFMYLQSRLGMWRYKSKSHGTVHEGYMFPLLVQQQLDLWPEQSARKRQWMSVAEAREACQNWWMREALEKLVCLQQAGEETKCT